MTALEETIRQSGRIGCKALYIGVGNKQVTVNQKEEMSYRWMGREGCTLIIKVRSGG